ncbi:unnamed protein product [Toxocara canis]|uniref:Uncharacterized protein n=1 Tax=Toxocara canis TaxID=6265 RepID=A0A183TXQ7_TOXCA|nr:unnamed protein product [Toxocara canis]
MRCVKFLEKKKAEKLLEKVQLEKLQLSEIEETFTDEEVAAAAHRASLRDLSSAKADAAASGGSNSSRTTGTDCRKNSLNMASANEIPQRSQATTMAASAFVTPPDAGSESDDEFFDASSEITSSPIASHREHGIAETRSSEKLKPISPRLNALAECVEPPASNVEYQTKPIKVLRSPRSADGTDGGASMKRSPRQVNTARIAPTVMNKSLSHSPRDEQSIRKSSPPPVSKAHSLTNPDLRDIEQIAAMQEIALREELMKLQRKASTQSDSSNTPPSRPQTGPSSTHSTKSNPAMSSSRSVDFFADAPNPPSAPHPTAHVSRLPTPLRRPGGTTRSLIPTPTSRISIPKAESLRPRQISRLAFQPITVPKREQGAFVTMNSLHSLNSLDPLYASYPTIRLLLKMIYFCRAVRGLAGGSTPSLAPSDTRRSTADETQSECGRNEWADECF